MKMGKTGKIIFIVVVVGALVVMGFLMWRAYNPDVGLVMFDEFEIEETPDSKIISHPKTGFSMSIPVDWEIKDNSNSVFSNSLNFKLSSLDNPHAPPIPKTGCIVETKIEKSTDSEDSFSNYLYIKDMIEICKEEKDCGYQLTIVDNKNALKHIYFPENQSVSGNYLGISIPKNENVYILETYLFGEDKEKCEEEFSKILETVKIK